MKLMLLITAAGEDDPTYLADEVQAHLEGLGYRHVDVEIHTNVSVDNSAEEPRP